MHILVPHPPNTEEYDSNMITSVSGTGMCGLHFQANGPRRPLLSTGPLLMSLQSYMQSGPEGFSQASAGTLPSLFSCLPLHFSSSPSLSLSDKQKEQNVPPSTNYRSPCLKGPLPNAKPLHDIIKG